MSKREMMNEMLIQAVREGNAEEVKGLIALGVDVNAATGIDITLLHEVRNSEIAKMLIEAGADVNAKGGCGQFTPLHYAAANNLQEIMKLLIDVGADVNAQGRDDDKRTPLHLAAEDNRPRSVKLLIEAGADVNVRDKKNQTPLHLAAQRNNTKIFEMLIKAGADVNVRDNWERTPLQIFTQNSDALMRQKQNEIDAKKKWQLELESRFEKKRQEDEIKAQIRKEMQTLKAS